MKISHLTKLIILCFLIFLSIGVTKVLSLSLPVGKYTVFKTENQGFKFYSINVDSSYYSASSRDIRGEVYINRLACDRELNKDECGQRVPNSNVGPYAYDIIHNSNGWLFKGYVRYLLPPGRQPAEYIRDPSMDIIVTNKEFSASPWQRFPYYGDYKIYKRAPCDRLDESSYDCQIGFHASSTETTLYDLHFSNPFKRNPNDRSGQIGFYARAFSTQKPVYSFSKLFAQPPEIDSDPNQLVTNEVFRQLLISSLYRQDYFELFVDHYLWIKPLKESAEIYFYGSSPYQYIYQNGVYDQGYIFGAGCPAGENNFPCKLLAYVFGFPVSGSDTSEGYFFRDFIKNYFKGQINQFISMNISGRSGDWNVNLCFDNNLKKIYGQVTKIRDEDHGNGNFNSFPNQGYTIFSDGRIKLTVDTNNGPGDVKIYLKRTPFINRTCANLGGYQQILDYSW